MERVLTVSSSIRASSPSGWVEVGGAGRERDGRPSEEKMASPPASSAVCSGRLDAMVTLELGAWSLELGAWDLGGCRRRYEHRKIGLQKATNIGRIEIDNRIDELRVLRAKRQTFITDKAPKRQSKESRSASRRTATRVRDEQPISSAPSRG